jgi:hypothetical protein
MRRRPGATAGHVARVNPEQPVDLIADGRIASVAVSDSALAPPALPHRIYSPRLTLRPHASRSGSAQARKVERAPVKAVEDASTRRQTVPK